MILKTLQEAIIHFDNPQNCIDYMIRLRWPDGVVRCPTCDSTAVTWMPGRRLFQCKAKHPRKQFSVKVRTVFEDSPIALSKWLLVAWMLGNCRNGVSSYEVARTIGITQKSAWFMLHRLREAMKLTDASKLGGAGIEVEVDESFVGGKSKFMHKRKRLEIGITNRGSKKGKVIVQGILERGGEVRLAIVETRSDKLLQGNIEKNVEPESCVITDELHCYRGMPEHFHHEAVNHLEGYVVGRTHTNSLENFWSCLKRTLKGTYISVRAKHLASYLDEQAFRFNVRRGFTEQQRHHVALHGIQGKRLTYAELISRA
jgi:transposase-like protein